MKINKKSIIFIILTIFVIFITPIQSRASTEKTSSLTSAKSFTEYTINLASMDPIENPNLYNPNNGSGGDTSVIIDKANQIIGTIATVGVVISVITIAILGIKFMLGSVEEKAEYKKSMIPYIIGCVLLFASSSIIVVLTKLLQFNV